MTGRRDRDSKTASFVPDDQQEQLLRAMETANHGVSLLDDDGAFVYVNEAYAETYRYDPEEMIGMHWEELYPEGMTDEIYEDVLPAVEDDGSWTGETVGLRSDGSQLIEDHHLAETDEGGLVCLVRDVTEKRHLERELEQIHDRITDAVIGLDSAFAIEYVNDRARTMFGLGDDPVGSSFGDALPEVESIRAELERAAEEGSSTTVREHVPALDAWLEVRVFPSDTGVSLYVQDVTAEQVRRERLVERETALREVYDVVSTRALGFEEKLDALLEICQDVVGTRYATFSRTEGDDYHFEVVRSPDGAVETGDVVPLSETSCERAIATEETLVIEDVPEDAPELASRAANRGFGIGCYIGAPVEVAGDVYGTFCFYDTEPQEEFSDWEVTFVDLLSRWVSYELERKHQQRVLETSNERLEQFAHAVSHDLQEPVRTVSTYVQLIDRRYGEDLDEELLEYLTFVRDGADRMREMVQSLLEYSRVETQGEPFEPVALDDVARDALANLEARIAERDAEVTVEDLPRVQGDVGQLRQVFQNLLENALEYNEGAPSVTVSATERGREYVVSVDDDGIGIDPADAEQVFEVFERLHTTEEYEGTGLGLALCERVVERHGGDIWIDSEPGEGTTVSFTLPPAEDPDAA